MFSDSDNLDIRKVGYRFANKSKFIEMLWMNVIIVDEIEIETPSWVL